MGVGCGQMCGGAVGGRAVWGAGPIFNVGSCVSFMSCASHPVKTYFTTPTVCLLETIYPHL